MAQKSGTNKVAIGAGILGLAAAGIAGAYFLYGKDGAKNKKKLSSWMLKAKAEVMDKLAKVKDLTAENFEEIVDVATAKYGSKIKDISAEDVQAFAKNLKKHWKDIKRDVSSAPAPKKAASKKK